MKICPCYWHVRAHMHTPIHNAGECGAWLGRTHFALTKKCRSKHHCQVFCRHLVAVSVSRNACEEREQLSNNAHVRFRHVFQHVSTLYDFGFTFGKAGASSGRRVSKKTECECKRADSTKVGASVPRTGNLWAAR
jgi:hypothetical protein